MPRSEEQNQLIRDERREEILTHALHIFAKKGYAAAKISDVAKSASLSPGLVYHYFESKEDMFIAVVADAIELTNDTAKKIDELPLEPFEKLRMLTETDLNYDDISGLSMRWLLMLQVALTESVPERAHELFQQNFAVIEMVRTLISEAQAKGQISRDKDAATLTTAYWSVLQGLLFFRAFNIVNGREKYAVPDVDTIFKLLK